MMSRNRPGCLSILLTCEKLRHIRANDAKDRPSISGIGAQRAGRVTKIAIDKRARESENKGDEESWASVVSASGRLCGEEAAGCSGPASHAEPDAAAYG